MNIYNFLTGSPHRTGHRPWRFAYLRLRSTSKMCHCPILASKSVHKIRKVKQIFGNHEPILGFTTAEILTLLLLFFLSARWFETAAERNDNSWTGKFNSNWFRVMLSLMQPSGHPLHTCWLTGMSEHSYISVLTSKTFFDPGNGKSYSFEWSSS